jgi:muramidase (phage lysozyme)
MLLMADNRKELLEKIGEIESTRGYDFEYGDKPIDLSNMTLKDVLAHQRKRSKAGALSTAIGRYQIKHSTLKSIVDRNPKDFPMSRKMDNETQDAMANILLDRRGMKEYESGDIDNETFADSLSKEWASLPNPATGKSYYDKDGLNKSLIPMDEFYGALESTRSLSADITAAIEQTEDEDEYDFSGGGW